MGLKDCPGCWETPCACSTDSDSPNLTDALKRAAEKRMTMAELSAQRVSWVVGQTGYPRALVERVLREGWNG